MVQESYGQGISLMDCMIQAKPMYLYDLSHLVYNWGYDKVLNDWMLQGKQNLLFSSISLDFGRGLQEVLLLLIADIWPIIWGFLVQLITSNDYTVVSYIVKPVVNSNRLVVRLESLWVSIFLIITLFRIPNNNQSWQLSDNKTTWYLYILYCFYRTHIIFEFNFTRSLSSSLHRNVIRTNNVNRTKNIVLLLPPVQFHVASSLDSTRINCVTY